MPFVPDENGKLTFQYDFDSVLQMPEDEEETSIEPVRPPREREAGEDLLLDDLLEPQNVKTMKDFLRIRSSVGKGVDEYSDEEVRDMYMSRMRDFDTSDVGIVNESVKTLWGQSEEDELITANAYELYDSVAPLWRSGTRRQAIEAVGEHLANIFNPFESPSTYATLGVGKLVTLFGGKGLAQVTKNLSKTKEISISIKKAEGTKCSRCWKIVEKVKDNKCSRCSKIK